ncbi:HEAT repeat domain-containing protein [Streptomyces sp. NPDC056411]|uniref:HEAT repeat domain-containing protein n=1 Tax=Streptomyces sp. NPDC056411 TaxID=3345813 RepID=UPI0035DC947D
MNSSVDGPGPVPPDTTGPGAPDASGRPGAGDGSGADTVAFDWHSVIYRDFDVELDEPGSRSGAALEALNAELGTAPDAQDFFLAGHWAEQLSLAVSAGLPALLGQLSHPDPAVRRILAVVLAYTDALPDDIVPALRAHSEHDPDAPVRLGLLLALGRYVDTPQVRDYLRHRLAGEPAGAFGAALGLLLPPILETDDAVIGEAVEALARCADEAGAALAELAWCDPEWSGPAPRGPVDAVDNWLHPTPALRSRWLTRMLPGLWDGRLDAATAPVLVEAADRLFAKDREGCAGHASAVTGLLGHPDPEVRRAAVQTFHLHLHDGYRDALAAILCAPVPDPAVFEKALAILTAKGDPRCLPLLQRRIRQGTLSTGLLRSGKGLADQVWPHLQKRLAEDIPSAEVCSLLTETHGWRGGGQAVPQVIGTLERLCRRIEATDRPDDDDLEAAHQSCAFLRRYGLSDEPARSALRRVAAGTDPELRLSGIGALSGVGVSADDEVVPLLLDVLARRGHTLRTGSRRGLRFEVNACNQLSQLGPRAQRAAAALRGLRDGAAEPAEARVAAAYALWRITGDADGAWRALIEQIPHDPQGALNHLGYMGIAAHPALPVLRDHARSDDEVGARARNTIGIIEAGLAKR